MFKISNIHAGYDPCYNPDTANNGGGYWQPYGDCTITLSDGTMLTAKLDDTSCGDFGDRWMLSFSYGDEEYVFCEDDVDSDLSHQCLLFIANDATCHRMADRFSIDVNELIHAVRCAINDEAWEEWCKAF